MAPLLRRTPRRLFARAHLPSSPGSSIARRHAASSFTGIVSTISLSAQASKSSYSPMKAPQCVQPLLRHHRPRARLGRRAIRNSTIGGTSGSHSESNRSPNMPSSARLNRSVHRPWPIWIEERKRVSRPHDQQSIRPVHASAQTSSSGNLARMRAPMSAAMSFSMVGIETDVPGRNGRFPIGRQIRLGDRLQQNRQQGCANGFAMRNGGSRPRQCRSLADCGPSAPVVFRCEKRPSAPRT